MGRVLVLPRLGNAAVGSLLRSPARPLLSGRLLLLTYTGRRTGRRFSLPVQYARTGHRVVLWPASPEHKHWRNFDDPAEVTLWIQGRPAAGIARVPRDDEERRAALTAYVERFPGAARMLGSWAGLPGLPESGRAPPPPVVVVDLLPGS